MGVKYTPVATTSFPLMLGKKFFEQGYRVFVETGTYLGKTASACGEYFDRVHSIEASETLFLQAKGNCAGNPRISLYCGDSRELLSGIVL